MVRYALMLCACLLVARTGSPCSLVIDDSHPRPTARSLVHDADVIVVATAVRTIDLPDRSKTFPPLPPNAFDVDGFVNGTVELRIDETIKGDAGALALHLTGRLVDADDFNPLPVPYGSVRPTGLSGACFTYDYRVGSAYLLVLKQSRTGALTPYWAALQPVNEQLRGDGDPWLLWVREEVAAK